MWFRPVTSQLRHALAVHPLLKEFLDLNIAKPIATVVYSLIKHSQIVQFSRYILMQYFTEEIYRCAFYNTVGPKKRTSFSVTFF